MFGGTYGSPRQHGFCCNACKYGEAGHTYHCTGYGYRGTYHAPATLVATAAITHDVVEEPNVEEPEPEAIPAFPGMYRTYSFRDRGPEVCDTFRIPAAWACGDSDGDFMHHLYWFFHNYGLTPDWGVLRSWQEFLPRIHHVTMHRPLTIHVLSEEADEWLSQKYIGINLNRPGEYCLNARSTQHSMQDVTGINWVVQAVLLTQHSCSRALKDAVSWVEASSNWQSDPEFAFVCSHATHRSVGCAVLLATFIYKHARIRFTTKRTIQAAMDFGMVPCPE